MKLKRRKGIKLIFSEADPEPDRVIVSMIEWEDSVYVATQKGIYRLENDVLKRLRMVEKEVECSIKRCGWGTLRGFIRILKQQNKLLAKHNTRVKFEIALPIPN